MGVRFRDVWKANGYVGLAFFISAGLMVFIWFCNRMSPFGDKTLLRIDLYHQYAPLFGELYQRLTGGGSLTYSWYTGLGGNFLGNFFNYLSSPTSFLVLLFGHENIPEAISTMVLLKCAFSAGAFAYLLRRVHGKNDASITAFGVLYSFCGWFIAYYWNVMWLDAMALLPLVMLGIYCIVHERKCKLYTITLAITLIANYYMGYMVCIFSVLFFLVIYFSQYNLTDRMQPNSKGLKRITTNRFLRMGGGFLFASILAGALAAVALLPVFMALKSSSATSGSFPTDVTSNFQIFDFLANHFADLYPDWQGSGLDKVPNVYSGVAVLLLVPLYLFVPKIKPREKTTHVLLLIFMYSSFNTNVLNYIWHGMHFPNDLPYRFSFLYSFLLLWMAYKVFIHLKEIPLRGIVGVGGFVALFVVIAEKIGSPNIQGDSAGHAGATILLTLIFLAVYMLLFVGMRSGSRTKIVSLTMLLLCCVITEVCAADVKNFEVTQRKPDFTAGMSDFQVVKEDLLKTDPSLFRMELTDSRTLMDPAWQGYRGVSVFSSMANERTANLESRLGLHSNFINSYSYNPNTPVYNAMHGIKYLVENQNLPPQTPHGSSYIPILSRAIYKEHPEFTRERFTVFENKYPLPIAFWVSDALRDWDTVTGTDPFLKQSDFWSLAGAGEGVFRPLELWLRDDFYGENGFEVSIGEQYVQYSGKSANTEVRIPFVIAVEETQNVYIKADASYVYAVEHTLPDGTVAAHHPTQSVWDIGTATPEQPLTVTLVLDREDAPADGGFYVYTYGLDMDVFTEGWEKLSQGGLNITKFSDTMLEGNISAQESGLLYTSIPYDEGWQVRINGKRVPLSEYVGIGSEESAQGGFLAVPLPAGEHRVELKYVPPGLYAGLAISCATLTILLVIGMFVLLHRRKANKISAQNMEDYRRFLFRVDLCAQE
jgi:uncharacterized membrane protein YfhO